MYDKIREVGKPFGNDRDTSDFFEQRLMDALDSGNDL